ncbi:MAG: HD domain-containing protein [Synergistaceae bacterium]|nr:HD domain-containing protein [Synergistaceae bacterium]
MRLKIAHSYRVAEISERIAKTVINEQQIFPDFSWLIGLIHDIGRFEQITRYETFKDALSVDHAELGANILFHDNLFDSFISVEEACVVAKDFQRMKATAETAIRLHNKLKLPEKMEAHTNTYTKILRDADKADIFRVLTEPPYNERNLKGLFARDEVMQCVKEHRCVPRPTGDVKVNELEALIAQCCMAFELEYSESRLIVTEQGYLKKLLVQYSEQLSIVEAEIMKAWGK